MTLIEFHEHAAKLADRRGNLWQIICMDAQGLDWVRDEEIAVLETLRADTSDRQLTADLDEVIAWSRDLNERVGA